MFATFEFNFSANEYRKDHHAIGSSLMRYGGEKTKDRSRVYALIRDKFTRLSARKRAKKLREFALFEKVMETA